MFRPTLQLPQDFRVEKKQSPMVCCSKGTTIIVYDQKTNSATTESNSPEEEEQRRSLLERCFGCFCRPREETNRKPLVALTLAFSKEFGEDVTKDVLGNIKGQISVEKYAELFSRASDLRAFRELQRAKQEIQNAHSSLTVKTAEIASREVQLSSSDSSISDSNEYRESSPITTNIDFALQTPSLDEIIVSRTHFGQSVDEKFDPSQIANKLRRITDMGEDAIPGVVSEIQQNLQQEITRQRLPRKGSIGNDLIRKVVTDTLAQKDLVPDQLPSPNKIKESSSSTKANTPPRRGLQRYLSISATGHKDNSI